MSNVSREDDPDSTSLTHLVSGLAPRRDLTPKLIFAEQLLMALKTLMKQREATWQAEQEREEVPEGPGALLLGLINASTRRGATEIMN